MKMIMTTKTTKSIFLAIVIVAVTSSVSFVAFSTDTFAENQTEQKRIDIDYPVDILNKEIHREYGSGDTRVVEMTYTVKMQTPQTYDEIVAVNKQYLRNLEDTLGQEGKDRTEIIKSDWKERSKNPLTEFKVPVVKVGEHSITFGTITKDDFFGTPGSTDKDPINALFWEYGSADDVESLFDDDAGWNPDACGGRQWVLIDDTAHGGSSTMHIDDHQVDKPGCLNSDRFHARIWDGGTDTHGAFDEWSIMGVHNEDYFHSIKTPDGWEDAEDEAHDDIESSDRILSLSTIDLGNDVELQGADNDGIALYVKLDAP